VFYGAALAIGDLDGNAHADLAIGVPGLDVGGVNDAGAVNVLYGSASGLMPSGAALWTQASPGVAGKPEYQDDFGSPVVSGDFDGDGYSDLGIGVVGEEVGGSWVAGAVNVLYGSAGGLTATGSQLWHQNVAGVPGRSGEHQFGAAMAAGDLDGDGRDDLAIGAPWDTKAWVGSVTVLYGTAGGLSVAGVQRWTQDSRGVPGGSESTDQFGSTLSIADFGHSAAADLAVGVPYEAIGARREAGRVVVLYGRTTGLSGRGAQSWSQRSAGVKGIPEPEDSFGGSLVE
jgi:FG-GAP repeat